jgi:uncharacterized metal-binding protein
MDPNQNCECGGAPRLIFACSGAADVGAIADRAARKLSRDGVGKMFCLAGVGGRVAGIMKNTEAAGAILAIDGCAQACAKNCLEQAGFTAFNHVQMADLGFVKGQSPVCDEAVARVAECGAQRLSN